MRRGNPRPFPSSSSSTIQLFPGWWAVVLSSVVELSISTISQMLLLLLQKVRTPTTNKNSSTSKASNFHNSSCLHLLQRCISNPCVFHRLFCSPDFFLAKKCRSINFFTTLMPPSGSVRWLLLLPLCF